MVAIIMFRSLRKIKWPRFVPSADFPPIFVSVEPLARNSNESKSLWKLGNGNALSQ